MIGFEFNLGDYAIFEFPPPSRHDQLERLTSQFFWDQADCVQLEALRAIEDELTQRIVRGLGIKLDTLFHDATNFFTFIASTNVRPELPQRGHSKQKRSELRLFSLALLVSREGHIPLWSQVYEGNRVDVRSFPLSLLVCVRTHTSKSHIYSPRA